MHVILLCAGVGKRLAPYTEERPKSLMEVDGKTLLMRHLTHARHFGAKQISIVTGHLAKMIEVEVGRVAPKGAVRLVENANYRTGSIVSLEVGLREVDDDVIFMDADVLYHPDVLGKLFRTSNPSCVLVDPSAHETGEEMMIGIFRGRATMIARRVSPYGPFDLVGESVGFFRIAKDTLPLLRDSIREVREQGGDDQEYEAALNYLFGRTAVAYERVDGLAWTEIDFEEDLKHARDVVAKALPPLPTV